MSFPTLLKNLVKEILKAILNLKINQTLFLYSKCSILIPTLEIKRDIILV